MKHISFQTFAILYKVAQKSDNQETYLKDIQETFDCSDWTDGYSGDELDSILSYVYDLSHCSIAKLRKKIGLTQAAMAELYMSSRRTIISWEKGERKMSDMDRLLISYTVFTDISYLPDDIIII